MLMRRKQMVCVGQKTIRIFINKTLISSYITWNSTVITKRIRNSVYLLRGGNRTIRKHLVNPTVAKKEKERRNKKKAKV